MKAKLKWLDEHFEETGMMILLVMLSCAMMLQVVMRYAFGRSLPWPEEFCRYCYVWMTYLSIGLTIRRRSYFRVTALIDMLPPKITSLFEVLSQVINLLFYGWACIVSFEVLDSLRTSAQSSPSMGLPMFFVYLILPIGLVIATFRSIQMIYLTALEVKAAGKGSKKADESVQEVR